MSTTPHDPLELSDAKAELDLATGTLHSAIRKAYAAGQSYRAIAEKVGLSHTRIGQIVSEE